jgi:hypothetical protein
LGKEGERNEGRGARKVCWGFQVLLRTLLSHFKGERGKETKEKHFPIAECN